MLISYKGHNNTIQVYSMTVMTHVRALEAGQSIQEISELITSSGFIVSCRFSGNRRDNDKRRIIQLGMRLSYLRALPRSRQLPY